MWREIVLVMTIILLNFPVSAQENHDVRYIAEVLSKEPEAMSEDEIQHYSDLLKRPLRLNRASVSQMMESGLFTRYQAASVIDYILRSGQICSFLELSVLDGFNEDYVKKIMPFVSLDIMQERPGVTSQEFTTRASLRSSSEELRYGYATRYKLKSGEYINASLAISRSLNAHDIMPDALSGSVCLKFKAIPAKVVVGDFNARFGQGLALWSGSDFSTLTSPSSFLRRASGISASSSFTGTEVLTGIATEVAVGRFMLYGFVSCPGIKTLKARPENIGIAPALSVGRLWRHGQIALTHYVEFKGVKAGTETFIPTMVTSCDFSACYKGVDVFSEFVYDWVYKTPRGIAGVVFQVGDKLDMATLIRGTVAEHLFAYSGSFDSRKHLSGTFSASLNYYCVPKTDTQERSLQLKFQTQWQYAFSEQVIVKLRVSERIRSWGERSRTDVRTDFLWQSSHLRATFRLNMLNCVNTSFLTYLELGHKNDRHALYLRGGVFIVDNWTDRIYAYERDAPGCYNSPAFYGRGVWVSSYMSWKLSSLCRLYFRAGYTAYPFMREKKPGKAELRLQTVFSF